MNSELPLRFFLASPSDAVPERKAIQECIEKFNSRQDASGARFELVGWEQVRTTAMRPQDAINQLISECHFQFVLFKNSWGSDPGGPTGFTSGTEEELYMGLLHLATPERPMRDVGVIFVESPQRSPQVQKLRARIIGESALLFDEASGIDHLRSIVDNILTGWSAGLGQKVPREVHLLTSSGQDVLTWAYKRIRGDKLVQLGEYSSGLELLAEAAEGGGPVEKLAYATSLRRAGRYPEALSQAEAAAKCYVDAALYTADAALAFAAVGEIQRVSGDIAGSQMRFEHARDLARGSDRYSKFAYCKISDMLGLAYQKLHQHARARAAFMEAFEVRRGLEEPAAQAQTLVNLARLDLYDGDAISAMHRVTQAREALDTVPRSGLHANVFTLQAQIHRDSKEWSDGVKLASDAVQINKQISNQRGLAISSLILAQCHYGSSNWEEADRAAAECEHVNRESGDHRGLAKATALRERISNARERTV